MDSDYAGTLTVFPPALSLGRRVAILLDGFSHVYHDWIGPREATHAL